jgi:hypothetical protein
MVARRPEPAVSILDRQARIPQHVVLREFAEEVIVLNISSGRYFRLNRTAGRMLAVVNTHETVREALATLSREFTTTRTALEADLIELCNSLAERGLVSLSSA